MEAVEEVAEVGQWQFCMGTILAIQAHRDRVERLVLGLIVQPNPRAGRKFPRRFLARLCLFPEAKKAFQISRAKSN